jgi:pyrroloquinoline-quinone synthase
MAMENNIENIIERFDKEVEQRKYTQHSWTKIVLDGKATVEGLKNWAIQKYHQTFLQIPIFSIVHTRSDIMEIRQFMVEQLIDEETTISSGSDAHYELMRRFAIAMGANEDDFKTVPVGEPVSKYVHEARDICSTEHPTVAMVAMYAGERQAADVARLVLEQLRKQFKLSDHDLEWFIVHSGDDAHADAEGDLIKKFGAEVPDLEKKGLEVIDRFMIQWGKLQDYYYDITTLQRAY